MGISSYVCHVLFLHIIYFHGQLNVSENGKNVTLRLANLRFFFLSSSRFHFRNCRSGRLGIPDWEAAPKGTGAIVVITARYEKQITARVCDDTRTTDPVPRDGPFIWRIYFII